MLMKNCLATKIWNMLYPIGMYYVVIVCMMYGLQTFLGVDEKWYMVRQIIASLVALPVLYSFYRYDRIMKSYERIQFLIGKKMLRLTIGIILSVAFLSVGLNNLIALSPLIDLSAGFQEANAKFFGGKLIFELLGSALLIPIVEELLFRGIVYQRGKRDFGVVIGALLSALAFALLHFNAVQGIYGFFLGIVLAFAVELTGHVYGAMIGHITANFLAVLRTETGCMDWMIESKEWNRYLLSGMILLIGILLFVGLYHREKIPKK